MTTKNDITGDKLATKPATDAYRDNWDRIFGKPDPEAVILSEINKRLAAEFDAKFQPGDRDDKP